MGRRGADALGIHAPAHMRTSTPLPSNGMAWTSKCNPAGNSVINPFTWTKRISQLSKCGQNREALRIYKEMREEGMLPNNYTFVAALKACSSIPDLEAGREIHAHLVGSRFETDVFVTSSLVNMYSKCRSMEDAQRVFHKMRHRNLASWTAMMIGYIEMEMADSALELYARIQEEGFRPDARIFVAALKACGSLVAVEERKGLDAELLKKKCLEQGRTIHTEVAKRGFESNIFVGSTLVDMYAKCGCIEDARGVFEKMRDRNVVSWTALILGYTQLQMGKLALEFYVRMQQEGFLPDARTFLAALQACGSLAAREECRRVDNKLPKTRYLEQGRAIHAELGKRGADLDIFVASSLVDMYVKCRSIEDARRVFENMRCRNVVTWTTIIIGYAQMEMGYLALDLFAHMQYEGFIPNARTFVAALKACGSLAAQANGVDSELLKTTYLDQVRAIHTELTIRGLESDVFVASTLIDMYAKCGCIEDARMVFETTRHRNVVSWNALILGYAQMDIGELALEFYARMVQEGFIPDARTFVAALKACGSLAVHGNARSYLEQGRTIHIELAKRGFEPDIFVASTLVDMYAKCGSIKEALQVFEKMSHRNVVSWNAMILGYAQMEMGDLALELYARMQHHGFKPDACTFIAALKACGSLASLKTGKEIHSQIHQFGLEHEPYIANCLVDMYGKCGSMVDAQAFFESLLVRDPITWSALVAGYSGQGDGGTVVDLYKRMQQGGREPDDIVFISVLAACSHNGLLDKGQKYFQSMCIEYGISPSSKHYMCLVDLLGRGGQLDEAVAVIKKMPLEPDIIAWMTILGACQRWDNIWIGRNSLECALILDESMLSPLMINTCVAWMWEGNCKIEN